MRDSIIISDAADYGDDGVAITLLLAREPAAVKLIIATSGNVWSERALVNLRSLLKGLGKPELRLCIGEPSRSHSGRVKTFEKETGVRFAGALGTKWPSLPRAAITGRDCRRMAELILQSKEHDLVVIGPATVAAAILRENPGAAAKIGRIYMMGGAVNVAGNATSKAELNVWFDPEASEALFRSSIPLTLLPLDALQNSYYPEDLLPSLDRSTFASAYLSHYLFNAQKKERPRPMWDEVLAASLIDSKVIVRQERIKLAVDTTHGEGYGSVIVLGSDAIRRPIDVIMEVDQKAVLQLIESVFVGSLHN